MTTNAPNANNPIGIFDSGVGGLSVLRHIRAELPNEHLLYLADSGYAPYGERTEQWVAERSLAIARFLIKQGAKALVVACNTATGAAIKILREHYPDMPIVGVEPGLKPAAAATKSGKVGVLATARTLAGDKFLQLRDQIVVSSYATGTPVEFLLQPAIGLVNQIELGGLDSEPTIALLEKYIHPLLAAGADTLVLGCTHYPFVKASIESVVRAATTQDITLIDTGDAVARRLAHLLQEADLLNPGRGSAPRLHGFTSASATALTAAFTTLLGLAAPVDEVEIPEQAAGSGQVCN